MKSCLLVIFLLIPLTVFGDYTLITRRFSPPDEPTYDWNHTRWLEYLARQDIDNLEISVPLPSGAVSDLLGHGTTWEVCLDSDWKNGLSEALLASIDTGLTPGLWLMCPDGRVEHYNQAQSVIQLLNGKGIIVKVRTITIAETKENTNR